MSFRQPGGLRAVPAPSTASAQATARLTGFPILRIAVFPVTEQQMG